MRLARLPEAHPSVDVSRKTAVAACDSFPAGLSKSSGSRSEPLLNNDGSIFHTTIPSLMMLLMMLLRQRRQRRLADEEAYGERTREAEANQIGENSSN